MGVIAAEALGAAQSEPPAYQSSAGRGRAGAPAYNRGVDLFDPPAPERSVPPSPLADRMRPRTLDEVVGQQHLVGPGKVLRRALEDGKLHSMILWGPPGTGKTTLAQLVAHVAGARFVTFSAVMSGVKEIRAVTAEAETERMLRGRRTILFVDEIHRFNKAQQDAFLPHVEKGAVTLVGATTENPSFEVNAALLSRCRVYVLQPLTEDDVVAILTRALADAERGLGATGARGRARRAQADRTARQWRRAQRAEYPRAGRVAPRRAPDRGDHPRGGAEEGAALRQVGRGALQPDLGLAQVAPGLRSRRRALLARADARGGEDPLYVARRMVRFASEDVGNADPQALRVTLDAKDAYHFLGTPEGELALAQAACYLALAPKSNAVYAAWNQVKDDIRDKPAEPVPLHIRNAPTGLMANLGYGRDYQYAHDAPEALVSQEHLPDALRGRVYYRPTDRGAEKELAERLRAWRQWRDEQRSA